METSVHAIRIYGDMMINIKLIRNGHVVSEKDGILKICIKRNK